MVEYSCQIQPGDLGTQRNCSNVPWPNVRVRGDWVGFISVFSTDGYKGKLLMGMKKNIKRQTLQLNQLVF